MTSAPSLALTIRPRRVRVVANPEAVRAEMSAHREAAQRYREAESRLEEDRQHLRQARESLETAAAELDRTRRRLLEEAEGQLLELATHIASKVLAQTIERDEHRMEPIVRAAVAEAPMRGPFKVRMHPEDLSKCQEEGFEAESLEGVSLASDSAISRGACVVDASEGSVERTPDHGMAEVTRALRSAEQGQ